MYKPAIIPLHETAWLLQWPAGIDLSTNAEVHACAQWLRHHTPIVLQQLVPAYDSLLVEISALEVAQSPAMELWLQASVDAGGWQNQTTDRHGLTIPVCFAPDLPNDLAEMSAALQLTTSEIIERFTAPVYYVYLLGFLPGFAYMGTVDERIALPRRSQPRQVAAGAVALADRQAGIYPVASPGGWHVLGYTPLRLFDAFAPQPSLLLPGQQVRFQAISFTQYQSML